jgi:hypothetical protein
LQGNVVTWTRSGRTTGVLMGDKRSVVMSRFFDQKRYVPPNIRLRRCIIGPSFVCKFLPCAFPSSSGVLLSNPAVAVESSIAVQPVVLNRARRKGRSQAAIRDPPQEDFRHVGGHIRRPVGRGNSVPCTQDLSQETPLDCHKVSVMPVVVMRFFRVLWSSV